MNLLTQRRLRFVRGRHVAAQGAADHEEGGDQHGDRHQHKEAAQHGVNLVAEHDGLHIRHALRRGDNHAFVDAFAELVRLRQKTDRGLLMENLLPARRHRGDKQPDGRQNRHPGVALLLHLKQHHGAEDQRH